MYKDFFKTGVFGCFQNSVYVVLMAVNSAIRNQSVKVESFFRGFELCEKVLQYRVCEERTFFNGHVYSGNVLVDNSPCAYVQMANFRVAHLSCRQADFSAGCVNFCIGSLVEKFQEKLGFSFCNGIAFSFFRNSEAVKNH